MYAVFSTGGKQYRATTGDIIKVEKLEAEKGATVELDQVLMVGEGETVNVGTPLVAGGMVKATVVEHGRGDKVRIIKFKRRKHHMKQMGHRQYYTMLEITGIEGAEAAKPAKKKVAAKKADKPADAETKAEPKAKKAAPKAKAESKAKAEPKAKKAAPKAKAEPKAKKAASKAKPKAKAAAETKDNAADEAKSED